MNYVYVLRSEISDRMYIGRCADLKARVKQHERGKTWTTKRMLPIKLVFYESFSDRRDAIRRERYLKTSKGKSTLKQMLRYSLK